MSQGDVSGAAVGWTWFAAVMMWLMGAGHVIAGLAGIVNDQFYVIGREYLFEFDSTVWGWVHLVAGALVFTAGVYLLSGQVWARTIGVILAVISVLGNFAWLPYYPVWSILLIAAGVFVIWALTVHGRDIVEAQ